MTAAGTALDFILRATLLIGAAWAAAALLRKAGASAATRHMAWLLGIFALLALPLVWWLTPPLRLPILRPEEVAAANLAPSLDVAPAVSAGAPGWILVLLAFYLTGVAAVMLRFALSRYLVARLWRQARPAREADLPALLADLSLELGISRPARLRIARGPAMPMTWGTLAPKILLPAEAHSWPPGQRRLVLLHELAHVVRRDSLGRSAASLACALYWFHPGAWFAARRMRLEQEIAADDRVLNAGAKPKIYARSLLDLAFSASEARWPDHAAAMAGACQLERRMMSITEAARRDAPGAAFHAAAAAICALTLLALAAALPVRPLPALSEQPDMAPTERQAAAAPVEVLAENDRHAPDRAAVAARTDARAARPDTGFTAPTPMQTEASTSFVSPPPVEETAMAQAAPPAAARLGPIGPQLPQPIAEQDSDPRIPASLRRRSADLDQRAGPGPPRSNGEAVLRTLPTAILQATGALPSR